jgi:hypothetical protein
VSRGLREVAGKPERREFTKVLRAAAEPVIAKARSEAPVRTGRLRASIKPYASGAGIKPYVRFGSRLPYANVINWGGTTGIGHSAYQPRRDANQGQQLYAARRRRANATKRSAASSTRSWRQRDNMASRARKQAGDDDSVARFVIDGKTYSLAFDDLTLGELVQLERMAGLPFQQIDFESARRVQGLAWIAIHRENPEFSIDDAAGCRSRRSRTPRPSRTLLEPTGPLESPRWARRSASSRGTWIY